MAIAFGRAVMQATAKAAYDPRRIQTLINNLSAAEPEVRYAAFIDLRELGEAAVTPMLRVLANPGNAQNHERIQDALVQLGNSSVEAFDRRDVRAG